MKRTLQKFLSIVMAILILNGLFIVNLNVNADTLPNTPKAVILTKSMVKNLLAANKTDNTLTLPNGKQVISALPLSTENKNIDSSLSKSTNYTYQNNVEKVDVTKWIKSDGSVVAPEGEKVQSGEIIVDEKNDMALYVSNVNSDGSLDVRQPSMSEIFSDLTIKSDNEIPLNSSTMNYLQKPLIDAHNGIHNEDSDTVSIEKVSNSTVFGEFTKCGPKNTYTKAKVRSASAGTGEEDEVNKALNGAEVHKFSSTPFTAYLGDGQKIAVKLSGDLAVNLNLDPDYSAFGGYNLSVTGAEMVNLKVKLDVNVKKEIYIPLFGGDVNFGIGNVRAGIFLVVDVDGKITVVLSGGQGMSLTAGVRGSTCFGVPTSFHPYATPHFYAKGECDPNGEISATVALTPAIDLSVLGIHVFNAELRLGLHLHAEGSEHTLNYGLNAIAKLHVEVLGEGVNIFNLSYNLFSRKKEYFGGYYFYGNLCAYRDQLVATVLETQKAGDDDNDDINPFADKKFYSGKVQVALYSGTNTEKPIKEYYYQLEKSDNGRILLNFNPDGIHGIDIRKNYSVRISIPNVPGAVSNNIFATMPFRTVKLDNADFFNEAAWGEVLPVTKDIDQPGLANEYLKSSKTDDLLYCANRKVTIEFKDNTGREKTTSVELMTDDKGKFRLDQIDADGNPKKGYFDIRPNREAKVVADIDGFPFESNSKNTESGLEIIKITDWRSNILIDALVYDEASKTYKSKKLAFNNLEELEKYFKDNNLGNKFSEESLISGDRILAVNRYGTPDGENDKKTFNGRKINGMLNVKTEAYHTRNIALYFADFHSRIDLLKATNISDTVDIDLRWAIMNGAKDLLFSQQTTIPINEDLNKELTWYSDGVLKDITDKLTSSSSRVSSAHLYRSFCITNQNNNDANKTNIPYNAEINQVTDTNQTTNDAKTIETKQIIDQNQTLNDRTQLQNQIEKIITPKTTITDLKDVLKDYVDYADLKDDEYAKTANKKSVLLKPRPNIVKTTTNDLLSFNQPDGTDATLIFAPTKIFQYPQLDFNSDLYINTEASMNVEGEILTAKQWDEWIYSATVTAQKNQQTEDQKMDQVLSDPLAYFHQWVINYQDIVDPADDFQNPKMNEWEPSSRSLNHLISIDTKKGTMTIDGISTKLSSDEKMLNGKISLNMLKLNNLMQISKDNNLQTAKNSTQVLSNSKELEKVLGNTASVTMKNGIVTIRYKN